MDAPVKELEQMQALREESRQLLEAEALEEALSKVNQALAIEEMNQRSLSLKADILEKQGNSTEAENLRALVKQIKKEAWQKQVEAEARGQHEVLGGAVRREKP